MHQLCSSVGRHSPVTPQIHRTSDSTIPDGRWSAAAQVRSAFLEVRQHVVARTPKHCTMPSELPSKNL
jgi:hypothetical protein